MQQQPEQEQLSPKMSLNILLSIMIAHVTPLEVLFRVPGTVGVRYFGRETFWAFFYIPLFGALVGGPKGTGQVLLLGFWAIYVIMLIIHRASSNIRWNKGCKEHSRYIGDSWLGSLSITGFQDDQRAKKVLEPATCFILGLIFMPFCPALGWYFLIGTLSLTVPLMLIERRDRSRKLDLQDASLESARLRQWSQDLQSE